jgi:hypothetical protein
MLNLEEDCLQTNLLLQHQLNGKCKPRYQRTIGERIKQASNIRGLNQRTGQVLA